MKNLGDNFPFGGSRGKSRALSHWGFLVLPRDVGTFAGAGGSSGCPFPWGHGVKSPPCGADPRRGSRSALCPVNNPVASPGLPRLGKEDAKKR